MYKKRFFCFLFLVLFSNKIIIPSEKIIFLIDKTKSGILYKVNNKQISLEKIFDFFLKIPDTEIEKSQVSILVNENVSFATLDNLSGILTKVGFVNMRFFVFNQNTKMMIEIFYANKAIPFSQEK